jgi:hypothetical protein
MKQDLLVTAQVKQASAAARRMLPILQNLGGRARAGTLGNLTQGVRGLERIAGDGGSKLYQAASNRGQDLMTAMGYATSDKYRALAAGKLTDYAARDFANTQYNLPLKTTDLTAKIRGLFSMHAQPNMSAMPRLLSRTVGGLPHPENVLKTVGEHVDASAARSYLKDNGLSRNLFGGNGLKRMDENADLADSIIRTSNGG